MVLNLVHEHKGHGQFLPTCASLQDCLLVELILYTGKFRPRFIFALFAL